MKNVILLITSFVISTFCFASNVPHVSNHGFPLNVKTSQTTTIIENNKQEEQNQTVNEFKDTKSNKKIEKNVPSKKISTHQKTETNRILEQRKDQKILKKEIKKEQKSTNKENNVFGVLGLCFGGLGLLLLWILPGLALLNAIPGLILSIIGLCIDDNKTMSILGLLSSLLTFLLFLIIIVLVAALYI